MMYSSSDMVHDGQTDGRTDRQKKWHVEVSDSLKKCYKLTENWK